ncbi:unnamed protein product [Cylicostephanus goldi]|uniref:Uncharacterized protein n=1 Tax=Cylicostephanus goldi TaxID=71465 RepID=A0A3P6R5P4_CYLGO|nr:unnamed protein product [Cylicostephanus goldi]
MADQSEEKEEKAGQPSQNGDVATSTATPLTLPKAEMSNESSDLIEESMRLLGIKSSVPATSSRAEPEADGPIGPYDLSASYR